MAGETVRAAAPPDPVETGAGGGTLMRRVMTPILLVVCLGGSGCSFGWNIRRNLINEPRYGVDECLILWRHERLARQAWDAMTRQYGKEFTPHYRQGFIDGFVDYLTYGGCVSGCGEAPIVPPVPPQCYQHTKYMTPQGYRAIEEWFMGFRHGSSTAVASGLRQLVVVPVMNPPQFGYTVPAPDFRTPPPAEALPTPAEPEAGLLPPPRPVPPDGAPAPPAGGGLPMARPLVPPG